MAPEPLLRWLSRTPSDELPTVVHPPAGDHVAWLGHGTATARLAGTTWLFLEIDELVAALPMGRGRLASYRTTDGYLVRGRSVHLRLRHGHLELADTGSTRLGERTARLVGGRWDGHGLPLPPGALRAPDLQLFPVGAGAWWTEDGVLHRLDDGGVTRLGPAAGWIGGPHGAVLVLGDEGWDRAAAPGAPLTPLPCLLARPGTGFSDDGERVVGIGLSELGGGVRVDLRSGELLEVHPWNVLPAGEEGWLDWRTGELTVGGRVVRSGLRHASCALLGDRLAGPGGRVWDLQRGEPVADTAPIHFGCTVATERGFVSVDFDGNGCVVDPHTGRAVELFALPREEGDAVMHGIADGDAAVFGTADGYGWRVEGTRIAQVPPPPRPPEQARPRGWPVPLGGHAVVAGRRWAWDSDGLLLVDRLR